MKKEVNYYSTDKLYKVPLKRKLNLKVWFRFLLIPSIILFLISVLLFDNSIQLNSNKINVGYNEKANVDYKVYLKQNDYYDKKVLDSGMQYVSNIINSINPRFNYEIHADKNIKFNYNYKITGEIIISDPLDSSKILYTKKYNLLPEKNESINSNNLVINKDIDIDYDYYNNYVNSYKMDYGLAVDSKLIVSMDINVNGKYNEKSDELNENKKLQISIPLSEQTLNIDKLTDNINESKYLSSPVTSHIKNKFLFFVAIIILIISLIGIVFALYLYLQNRKKDIYKITVNKILRDYDKIIVNGNVELDENEFSKKIYPNTFQEMVDASQNLNTPILYYEVIKGEKCFFIILNGDTMYKYRITKAYLEKQANRKKIYEKIEI